VQDELDRIPTFVLVNKGNLSVHALVKGASLGFSKEVLGLIDTFTKTEIDEAGICLACNRPTACGFHILRSVEVSAKVYVVAVNGSLPPMKNRNWGAYIELLGEHQGI